uniref:Uncharacterized protein n=1 Tax=Coccidioides posadasii RMSCC 3488 TaxID=454284 RepID=A0A0J6FLP3_COCPO|nr:hypothetical protein CPAG_07579 [Coccidioides posadasii RMSCC 3488]
MDEARGEKIERKTDAPLQQGFSFRSPIIVTASGQNIPTGPDQDALHHSSTQLQAGERRRSKAVDSESPEESSDTERERRRVGKEGYQKSLLLPEYEAIGEMERRMVVMDARGEQGIEWSGLLAGDWPGERQMDGPAANQEEEIDRGRDLGLGRMAFGRNSGTCDSPHLWREAWRGLGGALLGRYLISISIAFQLHR